jgi:hypothetical protein
MTVVAIVGWDEDQRWVGPGAWSREIVADSLRQCMELRSTEAKRLTRRLLSKESLELEVVALERARQLVHILESLGAKIEIRGNGDLTCV